MNSLDPRVNAYRTDLANQDLIGKVTAAKFVKGQRAFVQVPVAPLLKSPNADAMQTSQALWGETCTVLETKNGFAWVQLHDDDYVGYICEQAIKRGELTSTHRVSVPSTFAYPQPSIKSSPPLILPMNAKVTVEKFEGEFACLSNGKFVYAKHLVPWTSDFVILAEKFLNVPYLWGGKTFAGIDCSGLVQVSLQACAIEAPRDSDMQEVKLGATLTDHQNLIRGDLVFWPGHVGIMQDAKNLLHANGFHMQVTSEPLSIVIARNTNPVSSIKRLATIKP